MKVCLSDDILNVRCYIMFHAFIHVQYYVDGIIYKMYDEW